MPIQVIIMAVVAALLSGAVCLWLARAGKLRAVLMLLTLIALGGLVFLAQARAAQGYNGIGLMILSVFVFLPAVVGGAIGTLIGRKLGAARTDAKGER